MSCIRQLALGLVACCAALALPIMVSPAQSVDVVRVDITPSHRIQTFRPIWAFGSTVDKEPAGTIPQLYSKQNVRAMLGAGFGWLSYRLFTELSVQDWHWNPAGAFSAKTAGYWTSSARTNIAPISDSFGYRLTHRGNTTDQGNNADYSRLDDGDPHTYWKSDPYLTSAFTGDPDEDHPQWVVIDLESARPVDAMRIRWANPYATRYAVAYWTGDDPINYPGDGTWKAFPLGNVDTGRGSTVTLRLAQGPLRVRYVRLVMTHSSDTCDTHGASDPRNCVGYAIDELFVGTLDDAGRFHDLMHHAPCGGENPRRYACGLRQTATYTSSTDPWHDAQGRVRDQEQPGLDLIARSGLTRGIGGTYPVPMLYSTPQNAVAEVRYLEARGYPLARIELGEEPDGQYVMPEDDAALYLQWARAIHAVDPTLHLGGPVFSGVDSDLKIWPDANGDTSWLHRFLRYLRSHGGLGELSFMSFEHYPYGGCEHGAALQKDLLGEPALLAGVVDAWRADGVPPATPLYITEAGFSAVNFAQTPMQIEGALWLADYMASALSDGVSGAVYYQYEPVPLSPNPGCDDDWGNLSMFVADTHAHIRARAAQFFAGQMLTQQWVVPGDQPHELFPAKTNIASAAGPLVTAYAVHRPDGTWSVLLVNKDSRAHDVTLQFSAAGSSRILAFTGPVTRARFGRAQYVWRSHGAASRPDPDDPPQVTVIPSAGSATAFSIPALSITVLRGNISGD
ncbi:MAG TPA: discoidin domain-containing protein [Candidatus Acidoferrales bacterium]|nr:discoidin domain-containing protein [Candidatus Acidoferrales bacterium]